MVMVGLPLEGKRKVADKMCVYTSHAHFIQDILLVEHTLPFHPMIAQYLICAIIYSLSIFFNGGGCDDRIQLTHQSVVTKPFDLY